jgi:hypothetical protein
MIPIKIQCPCGQKYAFEIEPVGGRMPSPVACPVCGADGTAAANQLIAQHLPAQAAPASRLRTSGQSATPEQSSPAPQTTSAAPAPRRAAGSGARKKWLIPAIAGAVLLVAVAGGVWFWQDRSDQAEAAAAARDGLPHTLAELNQSYAEPPEGQNAATSFRKGFDALQITAVDRNSTNLPYFGKGQFPPPEGLLAPTMKSTVASFVQRNQAALSSFEQAAKCDQSRYPIDLTQGVKTLLPHLVKVKQAAQLEALSGLLQSDARQPAEAANAVLVALASARSLEAEPLLISQLTRGACVTIACAALERTLNQVGLPPGELDRLKQGLDQAEAREASGASFTCAMVGERANKLAMLELTPEQQQDLLKGALGANNLPAELLKALKLSMTKRKQAERGFILGTFRQALAARKEAFPARLKSDDVFEARVQAAQPKKLLFATLVLPTLNGQAKKEATSLSRLRLSQIAIALERFRATHNNQYPNALGELSPSILPAVPVDPFDGQPLRYRKQDSGYRLYGIGPDLKDDGGKRLAAGQNEATTTSFDLVFEVIKAPKAAPASARVNP